MLLIFIATRHAVGGPHGDDPSEAESSRADGNDKIMRKSSGAAQRKLRPRHVRRKMKLTPANQEALNSRNAKVRASNAMQEKKANRDKGKVCPLPMLLTL